jgi:hypothetical protein
MDVGRGETGVSARIHDKIFSRVGSTVDYRLSVAKVSIIDNAGKTLDWYTIGDASGKDELDIFWVIQCRHIRGHMEAYCVPNSRRAMAILAIRRVQDVAQSTREYNE